MIRSMTAFARREISGPFGTLTWEIRSLNHRFLELTVRLPEDLRGLEPAIREQVGKRVKRGKVECNLRLRRQTESGNDLSLNESLAQRLVTLTMDLAAHMPEPSRIDAVGLLNWPGVVEVTPLDVGSVSQAAKNLFDETMEELLNTREREGDVLGDLLKQRCHSIAELVEQSRVHIPEVRLALRERLHQRLSELEVEADSGRLEQELAIQLQKIDVQEELDRLSAHVIEIQRTLQRKEPVGRRLDFLMQELNREANTLGSKSASLQTSQHSVELKVLIEQMREQVQNIE